jgi:hypothetical protein
VLLKGYDGESGERAQEALSRRTSPELPVSAVFPDLQSCTAIFLLPGALSAPAHEENVRPFIFAQASVKSVNRLT